MERKQTMEHTSLLVLSLLQGQDLYGYQMITELERRSDHTFQMKEGTLYPVLKKLEKGVTSPPTRPRPTAAPGNTTASPTGAGRSWCGRKPSGKVTPTGSTPSFLPAGMSPVPGSSRPTGEAVCAFLSPPPGGRGAVRQRLMDHLTTDHTQALLDAGCPRKRRGNPGPGRHGGEAQEVGQFPPAVPAPPPAPPGGRVMKKFSIGSLSQDPGTAMLQVLKS